MKKIGLALFAIIVLVVLVAVGHHYWTQPRVADGSLRHLKTGDIVGYEEPYNTYGWKGIPFAQAPVGELRWRAPRPPASWQGVREALEHAPMCAQISPFGFGEGPNITGDEDCLYLNVWSPRLDKQQVTGESLPVMLWIHGGGNTIGTSDGAFGYHLAGMHNVIVVTIQYRLGIFGWLSHPSLRDTAATELDRSSNFAVLDMIAALQWVRDNIAAFGGNPANVTVFGQSAGGLDVYSLMASPAAKGLFHRAIVQSGSVRSVPRSLAENFVDDPDPGYDYSASELVNTLLVHSGRAQDRAAAKRLQQTETDADLLDFLQQQSVEQLLTAVKRRGNLGYYAAQPIRDGIVIPEAPYLELFSDRSRYNAVPVITGSTRDEYKFFLWMNPDFADKRWGFLPDVKDMDRYNRIARYFSDVWEIGAVNEPAQVLSQSQPGAVFAYRFDWDDQATRLGVDMHAVFGAAHGLEIPFVFGADAVDYLGLFTKPRDENQKLSLTEAMMHYWTSFARDGHPGQGGRKSLPVWQPWLVNAPAKLLFDIPVSSGVRMTDDINGRDMLIGRLQSDTRASDSERCELYAQLFYYHYSSNPIPVDNYLDFGCADYPLAEFREF